MIANQNTEVPDGLDNELWEIFNIFDTEYSLRRENSAKKRIEKRFQECPELLRNHYWIAKEINFIPKTLEEIRYYEAGRIDSMARRIDF